MGDLADPHGRASLTMSMRHALVLLITCASLASAQFPARVQVGTRVRVWLPEQSRQMEGPWRRQLLRGTIESIAADTLRLGIPGTLGTVAIPRSSIKRIEVSLGVSRGASMVER